jgi:site-specific DNA-methyltransferase (adenine-specific)
MIISTSNLLSKGSSEYIEKTEKELSILQNINAFAVQRNSGIDGFLKEHFDGRPVPVKIQSEYETIEDAIEKLERASMGKGYAMKIVIQTKESEIGRLFNFYTDVEVIKSLELQAKDLAKRTTKV